MSKYTTEVRYICEMSAGLSESTGFNNIGQVLHASHNSVIGDYPIFDEAYRETLNTKILKHYYTREICEETVGLWKLRINTRMNEIMPYYNKMYASELLNFNPFYDVDLTTSYLKNGGTQEALTGKTKTSKNDNKNSENELHRNIETNNTQDSQTSNNTSNETTSSTENTSTNKNQVHSGTVTLAENSDMKNQTDKYSDTPQGGITGLQSGTYLTNARIIDANETNNQRGDQQTDSAGTTEYEENGSNKQENYSTGMERSNASEKGTNNEDSKSYFGEIATSNINEEKTNNNTINTTEDYLQHVQGKQGGNSFSKLLKEYRETFINIDKMIIEELADLFFGLW